MKESLKIKEYLLLEAAPALASLLQNRHVRQGGKLL